jgi:hypothetical protein
VIAPSKFLQDFRATRVKRRELLSKGRYNHWRSDISEDESSGAETVLTVMKISLQTLKTQSSLADSILHIIGCADSHRVPHELLAAASKVNNDDMQLSEAISRLRHLSILDIDITDDTKRTYTVHSLVHLAIQDHSTMQQLSKQRQRRQVAYTVFYRILLLKFNIGQLGPHIYPT